MSSYHCGISLPSSLILMSQTLCTLFRTGDFVVDVGLSIRGYIFLKTVVVYPKSWRNKFVVSGYSSGIVIFVFSSMAWILHLCSQVDRPLILMQLLQFSVCICRCVPSDENLTANFLLCLVCQCAYSLQPPDAGCLCSQKGAARQVV